MASLVRLFGRYISFLLEKKLISLKKVGLKTEGVEKSNFRPKQDYKRLFLINGRKRIEEPLNGNNRKDHKA